MSTIPFSFFFLPHFLLPGKSLSRHFELVTNASNRTGLSKSTSSTFGRLISSPATRRWTSPALRTRVACWFPATVKRWLRMARMERRNLAPAAAAPPASAPTARCSATPYLTFRAQVRTLTLRISQSRRRSDSLRRYRTYLAGRRINKFSLWCFGKIPT